MEMEWRASHTCMALLACLIGVFITAGVGLMLSFIMTEREDAMSQDVQLSFSTVPGGKKNS